MADDRLARVKSAAPRLQRSPAPAAVAPAIQAFLDRAIELHRASGNRRSEGIALHQLALVRERSGRLDEAETLVRRAIERHVEIRNQRWEALSSLALARILDALERPEEAAAELARANAIFDVVGGRPTA